MLGISANTMASKQSVHPGDKKETQFIHTRTWPLLGKEGTHWKRPLAKPQDMKLFHSKAKTNLLPLPYSLGKRKTVEAFGILG
ncbi:hypothetical protein STEG23_022257 [Scotinomys teguina]